MRWHETNGDRHTAITVLAYGADTQPILDALQGALLTDAEIRCPQDWANYRDPFGNWHHEPCDSAAETVDDLPAHHNDTGGR
ncbi:hypothetical protein BST40_28715 [Mycobacterium persicum]|nr:hypothetical protein BST40_28715 [Mycobacterium persicum]ORB82408.1 hypothetical protein B1T49_28065 [Mycobacterium persicum]ORB98855.1 hypothetical protein B1T48_28085 [Mycobacterium persicum]